ncbi:uncharacterized protein PSFLO_05048 [Pseudozyma flocculosa]|uniref:Uncharacterized protein n=1 Tax=Pseudozyma flocculosa TaxID=84751 RepID=A0A5C3F792_9BASI|nr:uncharacterized protein PSFLO_05048 [Pseudozyma flocculosa]
MASSSLAATGLTSAPPALQQNSQRQTHLPTSNGGSPAPSSRSAAPITTVAIRNGKTIGINDHIYISAAWAPGAGEPYVIARVMEFVTAASSRSGAAALASSSGTLQVRANLFLRMRDITVRSSSDPRLLVATMHSDVFNLENVRGICNVRHRDLIGSGSAPDVSQWKKKEDHFYYHQLYDRYIHRFYDVIPTEKVKNVPPEVLSTLRQRYSFVIAEPGMMADLCDALRGCAVCHRWAASVESVRCDTCKKFFHMKCLNPPLASKPAKGYSWTCAPCSKRHEQDVGHALAMGGTLAPNGQGLVRAAATASARGGRGAAPVAARGRGRGGAISARRALTGRDDGGFSDHSPDGSPAPEKTIDDIRGTRCFNRWPYRYFGQHTHALDVLDPHDSVYPIAATRLGVKYQAVLPSWQEQQAAGLGVHFRVKGSGKDEDGGAVADESAEARAATAIKRKGGRPAKRKRGGGVADGPDRSDSPMTTVNTPTMLPAPLPSEPPEFERGTDQSVEAIFLPSVVAGERNLDVYLKAAHSALKGVDNFNVDFLDRALTLLTERGGDMVAALQALSQSKPEDLRIVHWTSRELKQFDTAMRECSSDMRQLKKRIPTKRYSDIVRHFVVWKVQRLREDLEAQAAEPQGSGSGAASSAQDVQGPSGSATSPSARASVSRAVSPSLSVFGDDDAPPAASSGPRGCSMCSTTTSEVWYKGHHLWPNRYLCINCGLYWRKYAAEAHNTELVSVNTRHKTANAASTAAAVTSTAAEENGVLGVAPFTKLAAKGKERDKDRGAAAASTSAPQAEPAPCVLCGAVEPRASLAQCQSCSLSVHQACFGLDAADMEAAAAGSWLCEACENEETLDAALVPRCILCSRQAQDEALRICIKRGEAVAAALAAKGAAARAALPDKPRGRGRPSLESIRAAKAAAAAAAAASRPPPPPLGPLDAFKPTECNNWVHVLCALFTPEVVFSDPLRLKTVEGCGNLPAWRYESTCYVCDQRAGSCITCAESGCRRTFHVSCAVNRPEDFAIGFEVGPPRKKGGVETTTFRGETGVLSAVVYCADHRPAVAAPKAAAAGSSAAATALALATTKGARFFGLAELDDDGASTALQLYARTYKHVGATVTGHGTSNAASSVVAHMTESSYALLRRAKRFDLLSSSASAPSPSRAGAAGIAGAPGVTTTPAPTEMRVGLHIGSSSASSSSSRFGLAIDIGGEDVQEEAEECWKCHTKTSPFWWSIPPPSDVAVAPPANTERQVKREEGVSSSPLLDGQESAPKRSTGGNPVCCTFCRATFFPSVEMHVDL